MTCEEFEELLESSLVEAAGEGHVGQCVPCAQLLNDTRLVRRSMDYLVVNMPTVHESAALARRITRPRPVAPPFDVWKWSRLVTAGVGLLVFMRLAWCIAGGVMVEPAPHPMVQRPVQTLTERMDRLFSKGGS